MKFFMIFLTSIVFFGASFIIDVSDHQTAGTRQIYFHFTEAKAYIAGQGRRIARRTARRTARRVSRRHNYYRPAPVVVGGAAVAATAIAIGTRVTTLPPACTNTVVNGITYYNCNGTYYQPVYDGPNIVYVVVQNPSY
jgi:hypothetical protein